MGFFKDIKELLRGIMITSRHLTEHAITIQYPEETWEMPARSRGIVVLLSDKESGDLNCTGCLLCMRACPTGAIIIDAPRGEDKKRQLKSFVVDNGLCCFCGLCEEACNFSALKMATKYEFSTENKEDLIWDIKKLQEVGSDVDYIDTRKKKKPKPAAPANSPDTAAQKPAATKNTPVKSAVEPAVPDKPTTSDDKPAAPGKPAEPVTAKEEPTASVNDKPVETNIKPTTSDKPTTSASEEAEK